jgi:predicted lipid-binding transport protein (Tim44 family)
MISMLFLFFFVLEIDAAARVGGGRSFGGRGSRSYTMPRSPSSTPTSPSRQYSPSPSQPGGSPYRQPQSGGFLRSLGGGILGGILGGMLFRSLGFGGSGGMGGGIGLFDIILIGLILYGIWWFIKKRRQESTASGPAYYRETSPEDNRQPATFSPAQGQPAAEGDIDAGIGHIRQMDNAFNEQAFKDQCTDSFFRVQGAWANRDMSTVRDLLTDEMFGILEGDAEGLKRGQKINRLDNIAVRTVDIAEAWQEGGSDFITVRFLANLLDYTVDETSGRVLSGSKTEPVKFEEYWTFTRSVGNNPWRLSAITQSQ